MNNKLDKFLYKVISRKLLVFLTSTVFFCLGMMTSEQWLVISTGYITLQSVTDTIVRVKGSFESSQLTKQAKSLIEEVKNLTDDK